MRRAEDERQLGFGFQVQAPPRKRTPNLTAAALERVSSGRYDAVIEVLIRREYASISVLRLLGVDSDLAHEAYRDLRLLKYARVDEYCDRGQRPIRLTGAGLKWARAARPAFFEMPKLERRDG